MAEIIEFAPRGQRARHPKVSMHEIANAVTETLIDNWEKAAKSNHLVEFIADALGSHAVENKNYLTDLNAISSLESRLGMTVSINAPFVWGPAWRAGFFLRSVTMISPDMPLETHCRCFNILLFLKMKRELHSQGMSDQL